MNTKFEITPNATMGFVFPVLTVYLLLSSPAAVASGGGESEGSGSCTWHSRERERTERNKAWNSCLNILMLVAALTHKDLCPSVIFCRPCKAVKEAFPLRKSSQGWAGTQAKTLGIFLAYSLLSHEVSCQILLILSLNLSWIHSFNSILPV